MKLKMKHGQYSLQGHVMHPLGFAVLIVHNVEYKTSSGLNSNNLSN